MIKKNTIANLIKIQFLLLMIPISVFSQVDLEDGLIAYYSFCGNAIDESNNENNGSVNEATLVADRFGNMDNAYQFDGVDDYIDCGNASNLNEAFEGLTISTWIYLMPGGGSQQQIVGKWSNSLANDHYTIIVTDNKILFAVGNPDNSANGFTDDTVLDFNTWYQVLVTWDNAGVHKIFIDKTLELDEVSVPFNWISTTSNVNLKIGRQIMPTQHNRAFTGLIDDVRIYNRVLNQLEIDSLYNFDPKQVMTSANDVENLASDILISPNPTSNYINVQTPENVENYNIELFDSKGKRLGLYSNIEKGVFSIDTNDLPEGIVFVNIYNEQMNFTKKVIVN